MHNYKWHACEPIRDLRELVVRSARKFGKRDVFRLKNAKGGIMGIGYSQLANDVNALGTALTHLGLKGKHIALIGENSYEWVVAYLAIVNGLGVVVPLDKELNCDEITYILQSSDSEALLCSETLYPVIQSILPRLPNIPHVIGIQPVPEDSGFMSFSSLLDQGGKLLLQGDRSYLDLAIDRESLCVLLYTSGTTGSSKGVMLSHKNIVSVIIGAMSAVRVERVTMSVLPIHHTYECSCGILTAIYAGVTICINDSLKYLQDNLKLFKPTMLVLVPLFVETMYKRIIQDIRRSGREALLNRLIAISNGLLKIGIDVRGLFFKKIKNAFGGRLKLIVCGGAPLKADLVTRFREFGIQILNGYGITECAPLVSANRNKFYNDRSVGVVIPCCEVKIDQPDEYGEGEILVRGDNVMLGYYKNPAEMENAFDGDWFRTGDLGRMDGNLLCVTGRKKNTIILSNGKNVQPEELEEYITGAIPYVKDVVVYASFDSDQQSLITALVVPDMDYIENNQITDVEKTLHRDIHELNRRLPSYKQVGSIRIQADEFEKTTTKKIKRFKILGEELIYAGQN